MMILEMPLEWNVEEMTGCICLEEGGGGGVGGIKKGRATQTMPTCTDFILFSFSYHGSDFAHNSYFSDGFDTAVNL